MDLITIKYEYELNNLTIIPIWRKIKTGRANLLRFREFEKTSFFLVKAVRE